jgi:hypothetical protein
MTEQRLFFASPQTPLLKERGKKTKKAEENPTAFFAVLQVRVSTSFEGYSECAAIHVICVQEVFSESPHRVVLLPGSHEIYE